MLLICYAVVYLSFVDDDIWVDEDTAAEQVSLCVELSNVLDPILEPIWVTLYTEDYSAIG
jgi:ABC-type cobalt transport system substrate-binding protein